MPEYEFITYKVVWYAELGYVDGHGMGIWHKTTYSKGWSTSELAMRDLLDHPDTVPEDRLWSSALIKHKGPYGELRVRRAEEQV